MEMLPGSRLDEVALSIAADLWGKTKPWGGAGVVILVEPPSPQPGGFYPDPSYVVTMHVGELSWLFVELRNIANKFDGYSKWKAEFFGRLAVRAKTVPTTASIADLLFTTLREAYELLGILEVGMTMHDWTPVIVHPRTVGDDIEPFDREAIKSFFETRGVAIS
jgi:hypothetical protein